MKKQYYIDNYSSGCQRDISGPYPTLKDARKHVEGIKVSIEPHDGVVEQLKAHGETVTLAEAWSHSEESEDYQAIYSVA